MHRSSLIATIDLITPRFVVSHPTTSRPKKDSSEAAAPFQTTDFRQAEIPFKFATFKFEIFSWRPNEQLP